MIVGAVTIGSVAVYQARAMLDAEAERYAAKPLDAHRTSETATLAIAVSADSRTTGSGLPAAADPAVAVSPPVTGSPAVHDVAREEPRGEVTGAITQGGNARFTTVYIRRGADLPSAYIVPRE